MAIHLFAPNSKKATLTAGEQAAISVGEIIVLGAIVEAIVATTEYLAGNATIDGTRLLTVAGLAFLLAVMKGIATYISAKAAPSTPGDMGVTLAAIGDALSRLEAAIATKTEPPAASTVILPPNPESMKAATPPMPPFLPMQPPGSTTTGMATNQQTPG